MMLIWASFFLFLIKCFYSYDDSLAVPCKALCQLWSDWNNKGCPEPISMSPEDLKTLSPSQIQEFLAQLLLGPPLSCQTIEKMQQIYGLNGVQNAEIKLRYAFSLRVNVIKFHSRRMSAGGYVCV